MRLSLLADVVAGVAERSLSPASPQKGIIFPVHIEVGSGEKALRRYFNLFLHRTEDGIMVGAHRPTGTPPRLNTWSLSDWELLTHQGKCWLEDGVFSFLIETYVQLAKKYTQNGSPKNVPVEVRLTRPAIIAPLTRVTSCGDKKKISLEFPPDTLSWGIAQ